MLHTCRRMLVITGMVFCLFSSVFAYSGGSGEPNDPYQIATVSDWQQLMNTLSDCNKNFLMTADVNLQGITLTPVGYSDSGFTGVFDGSGHIIQNAYMNCPRANYIGIFGNIGPGGQIRNLGAEDVNIMNSFSSRSHVGGLAGCNYGTIYNCHVTGTVAGSGYNTGGIIGENYGIVTGCYATGVVSGGDDIGGLIGKNAGNITNCYAAGTVTDGYWIAGGLVGENNGYINICYATGMVTGGDDTGGLIGLNNSNTSITACYATGMVSGNNYIGGLVGYNNSSTNQNYSISNCYATGVVSGNSYVGGLVGYNNSPCTINRCYATGAVSGSSYAGGLVGCNDYSDILACFWDIETSGQTTSSAGGEGKTTAEMKTLSTFISAGWDFTSEDGDPADWVMPENDYPHLAWEYRRWAQIPDVNGMSFEEAADTVKNAGFLMGSLAYINDENVPVGYIISQDPVADTNGILDVTGINMVVSCPNQINIGSGTISDPYQISTIYEWLFLTCHQEFWDKYFILINDLDFKNGLITPIGSDSDAPFAGVFDGNSHIIRNVAVIIPEEYVGLFGCINSSGQIHNLGAESVVIIGKKDVGGLAGNNAGTIANCYATGTISSSDNSYDNSYYFGGLVGHNGGIIIACYTATAVYGNEFTGGLVGGNETGGIITNCYATGAVRGSDGVGGLVGTNWGGTIVNCYSTGAISNIWDYAGGLVGYNDGGSVVRSFWDVNTSGQTSSAGGRGLATSKMKSIITYQNAGWADNDWVIDDGVDYPHLAWENTSGVPIPQLPPIPLSGSGTEQDPYQISTVDDFVLLSWYVSVQDKHIVLMADLYLSGVALYPIGSDLGFSFTGVFDGNGHTLHNVNIKMPGSDNIGLFSSVGSGGQVRNLRIEDITVIGGNYVGGLAGRSAGNITNCYVTGTVTGGCNYAGGLIGSNSGSITACYTTGTASGGGNYIGGLAGENYGGIITDCYSTDAVSGTSQVGGLTGYNNNTVTNCYATGAVSSIWGYVGGLIGHNESAAITDCYATGAVSSIVDYTGGLIGQNRSAAITDCYATGVVSSIWGYAGGLMGDNGGSAVSSFWDVNTSGQTTSAGGEGKTTEQMQDISTFINAGWDFVNIWKMCTCDADYPRLRRQCPVSFYSGGSGTAEDPYKIATVCDWQQLMKTSADWKKYFIMTADVDLQGVSLIPVGNFTAYFFGVFDGNNHIVRNAKIIDPNNNGIGLFGCSGGRIRNLGVEDANISGNTGVGGLAGYTESADINNCYSTGNVNGDHYVGGLVGYDDYGNKSNINGCYSKSTVNGLKQIGGLVGLINAGYISRCFSTGSVNGNNNVGGLAGCNIDGDIINCYSTGAVSGDCNCGGFTGVNMGSIHKCYSNGTVSGDNDIGGLAGLNWYGDISDCYSTGAVSGNSQIGGLAGSNYKGSFANSFWDVNTSGQTSSVGGEGKTTTEMETLSTFTSAGWDFSYNDGDEADWFMQIDEYPILVWQISPADIYTDGKNNFKDFAIFAEYWMRNDCAIYNDYCDWADLNFDGSVNHDDLIEFMSYWLEEGIYE